MPFKQEVMLLKDAGQNGGKFIISFGLRLKFNKYPGFTFLSWEHFQSNKIVRVSSSASIYHPLIINRYEFQQELEYGGQKFEISWHLNWS